MLKMEEERYLPIFITPTQLGPICKKNKKLKPKEKFLKKEIQGTMITKLEMKGFNNIPISRTTIDNIEVIVPVKITCNLYKTGDIIIGDLFTDEIEKRAFVISNDIICDIVKRDDIEDVKITNVSVKKSNTKRTSGCSYSSQEVKY